MNNDNPHPLDSSELRRQAEELLKKRDVTPDFLRSKEELLRMVQELSIHQIELEMQNEELQDSRNEIERQHNRYIDLYDFSPVGYLTLSRDGTILQANLTMSRILSLERSRLLGARFGSFIAHRDLTVFNSMVHRVFQSRTQEHCEIMIENNGTTNTPTKLQRTLRLDAIITDNQHECRLSLTDISDIRQALDALKTKEVEYSGLFEAEEELRQSDARFRTLFNSRSAIQVLLDPDTGKVLDLNQAAAEWYGWSVDELKQMYTRDVNTLSQAEIEKSLQTVDAREHNKFIGQHRRADGSVRDVEIYRNRIEIDGKPVIHAIIHDITERKLAEAELERLNRVLMVSDQCNKAMIHAQDEGELLQKICRTIVESGGYRMAWVAFAKDDEAKSLQRATSAGSIGDYFESTTISWADNEYGQGPAGTAIRTGQPVAVNHILTDPQFNLWRIQAIKNGYAAVLGLPLSIDNRVVGALTIYSEQQDAFNATETLQLTSLADNLAFGIKMLRQNDALKNNEQINALRLRILQMADTHTVEEMLMATLDEAETLTGSSIGFVFFVAEDQNSLLLQAVSTNTFENMCKAEGKGVHYPLDKAGVWADAVRAKKAVIHNDYPSLKHRKGMPVGHAEIVRELVIPVNRDGKIVAIMGVGNKRSDYDDKDIEYIELIANHTWDIVAKKIAEEKQNTLAAKLQQASKMEMIGQLAAGIAHEIANPLNYLTLNEYNLQDDFDDLCLLVGHYRQIIGNVIDGQAETKELEELRKKESEFDIGQLLKSIPETLENSKKGIERITAITRSMKSYSFKNVLQNISALDLNKVVHETLVIAKHEYSDIATVTLSLAELPPLYCEPSQINQVVLNLVINASHAIRSQNRKDLGLIAIKTWATALNIFFSITDDGPGIAEEIQKSIFDPFFTTKEQGQGTGLGLSISHEIIVKQYQGTLSVGSPSEGGTMFTFSLPIQIAPQLLLPTEKN
ncbi:MAG: GAF domain-containing protein [Chlorobiaceae bacterium]